MTRLQPFQLEKPVGLQMALIGSRGQINFSLKAQVEMGLVTNSHYFDVVNIDKFDVIIGTLFLQQNRVKLDFQNNAIVISSQKLSGSALNEWLRK